MPQGPLYKLVIPGLMESEDLELNGARLLPEVIRYSPPPEMPTKHYALSTEPSLDSSVILIFQFSGRVEYTRDARQVAVFYFAGIEKQETN